MGEREKITLGISGQALGDVKNFEEIVSIGAEYGVHHFEVWPANAPGSGLGYLDRNPEIIQKTAEQAGAAIDCVTLEAAFVREAVEDRDYYEKLLKNTIDTAVLLGAKLVNHYCYFINLDEKPDFEKMDRYWGPALNYAKEKGVTLVLENEAHDATRRPELMAGIMEHFNDSNFRTNYDAVNYFHASCEGFPAAYEILKPWIGYVHLKNACLYRERAGQRLEDRGAPMSGYHAPAPIQYAPLPYGAVNMAGMLTQLLQDETYHGTCTLEPHTTPEYTEEFYRIESQWLRSLGFI